MTYEIEPQIVRLVPFKSDGNALAAVDIAFGPIIVNTILYRSQSGYFLSLPSRKNESQDKWYEQVSIADVGLKMKAQVVAVAQYERLANGELLAV